MAPVHTFPFLSNAIQYKYSNLIDHNISTVPFTRYLLTYPDINVADTEVRILVAIHLIATDTTHTNGSLLN